MSGFGPQLEAIGQAYALVQRLREGMVWALTCTNDDDRDSPSVLNIYISEAKWAAVHRMLGLGVSVDHSSGRDPEQFVTYRSGNLHVSFIDQEES